MNGNGKLARGRTSLGLGVVLTLCVLVAACGGTAMEPIEPESAQTPPPSPAVSTLPLAVSTNAVMVAIVDHASHAIWDAGVIPPSNDEEWAQLDYHAIQVAASGALVSMGWAGLPTKVGRDSRCGRSFRSSLPMLGCGRGGPWRAGT